VKALLKTRHGFTPAGAEGPPTGFGGPGEALAGEKNLVKKVSNVFFLSGDSFCPRKEISALMSVSR
jgi:hypothetical protein